MEKRENLKKDKFLEMHDRINVLKKVKYNIEKEILLTMIEYWSNPRAYNKRCKENPDDFKRFDLPKPSIEEILKSLEPSIN